MPKKIKYNNPYYLELLKSLVILVNKGKEKYRDGLSVKERWFLSKRYPDINNDSRGVDINPDHLARIFQKKLTKKAHYSLESNSLDELVKYISSSYNYKDYPDFTLKEDSEFAKQFDGSKHFFDYSDEIKEEVREKVDERIKEILGISIYKPIKDDLYNNLIDAKDLYDNQKITLDRFKFHLQNLYELHIKDGEKTLSSNHLEVINSFTPKLCMGCGKGYDTFCSIKPFYIKAMKVETDERFWFEVINKVAKSHIIEKNPKEAQRLILNYLPKVRKMDLEILTDYLSTAQRFDDKYLSFSYEKLTTVKELHNGNEYCVGYAQSLRCSICNAINSNHPNTKNMIKKAGNILSNIIISSEEEVTNLGIWLEHHNLVHDYNRLKHDLTKDEKTNFIERVNKLFKLLPKYSYGFRPEQKSFLHKILFNCSNDIEVKAYNLFEAHSLMRERKVKYTCVFDFDKHQEELDFFVNISPQKWNHYVK